MEENYENIHHQADTDTAAEEAIREKYAPQGHNKTLTAISKTLLGLFLPLFVPTYSFVTAMWITPMSHLPELVRLIFSAIVFGLTALVPLATIIFLIRKGVVKDVAITNPKERAIPYVMAIICYFLTAFILRRLPSWLPMCFVGAGVAGVLSLIINLKWKISAHASAMGGLCAVLAYIAMHHMSTVIIMPWIAVAVFFSGAVGSARLYLGKHTLGQVCAGWLMGLIISYIFMSL